MDRFSDSPLETCVVCDSCQTLCLYETCRKCSGVFCRARMEESLCFRCEQKETDDE